MGVRYMDMVMAHGHCIQIARRKLAWLSSLLIGLSQKQRSPSTTPTPPAPTRQSTTLKRKNKRKKSPLSPTGRLWEGLRGRSRRPSPQQKRILPPHLQLFIDYYEVWFSQRGG